MDTLAQLKQELEDIKEDAEAKILKVNLIEKELNKQQKTIGGVAKDVNDKLGNLINKEAFVSFFEKPYVIIPQGKNKVLVAVPKFIKGFQMGWLWKETDGFYIYQLDHYSAWLGDVPPELLEEINFKKEIDATITDNQLNFKPSEKDIIKRKFGNHITDVSENTARIIRGHEFEVIAEMVESGNLPFRAKPVDKGDLRTGKSSIVLRDYQKPAFKKFLDAGAVGLFHPTGAGKSMVALNSLDVIKGNKCIIVPTRTLVEQWHWYIETYIPHAKDEIDIYTYQGYRNLNKEYSLVVYDEVQRLPADTFSRLALIKTKYRLGLSASPHREDGRESYIFALTGFPVGLNWQEYMREVGRTYHPVYVHVVRSDTGKSTKLRELVDLTKKTIIFCDTIDLGKKIAKEFNIPYVYGDTGNRLETVENNKVLVVSRVMDLGVSIKDLQRIIEVDFLFGSRQQELQRTGRLMHSLEKNTRHDIIMTEKEMEKYGKRLWALQEKGFHIKVVS